MRRVLIVGAMVLTLGTLAFAQEVADPDAAAISHGEFAVLLLTAMAPAPQQVLEPEQALADLKELGLVPSDWAAADTLTHGELADVAMRLGMVYTPADPLSPVSPAFAEAFLRRQETRLRDYRAGRSGPGFTTSHILDQGIDRGVSPSDFP